MYTNTHPHNIYTHKWHVPFSDSVIVLQGLLMTSLSRRPLAGGSVEIWKFCPAKSKQTPGKNMQTFLCKTLTPVCPCLEYTHRMDAVNLKMPYWAYWLKWLTVLPNHMGPCLACVVQKVHVHSHWVLCLLSVLLMQVLICSLSVKISVTPN